MANALKKTNTRAEVDYRENVIRLQDAIGDEITSGRGECAIESKSIDWEHVFTPVYERFGCALYSRIMHVDKGVVAVGKISKEPFLNIIVSGKMKCPTEDGIKIFEGPSVFVSPAGNKRCGIALEDTIWITVHPTEYTEESDLELIESNIATEDFSELGLIATLSELTQISEEKD